MVIWVWVQIKMSLVSFYLVSTWKTRSVRFKKSGFLCSIWSYSHRSLRSSMPTMRGYWYFVVFVHDYSWFTWIYLLKHKSKQHDVYITFAIWLRLNSKTIKVFRTDSVSSVSDTTSLSSFDKMEALYATPVLVLPNKIVVLSRSFDIVLTEL